MAAPKVGEIVERARSQTRLSWLQMFATALAAISMAVISSQITNAFNSILAVGLVSMVSAMVGEFWRFTVTVGAESAKQIVEPVLPTKADEDTEGKKKKGEETEVFSTVDKNDEVQVTREADITFLGDGRTVQTEESTRIDLFPEEGTNEESLIVPPPPGGKAASQAKVQSKSPAQQEEKPRGKWGTFWYVVMHSQALQMSLLFAIIGLVTIGISYSVAKAQGGNEYHITNVQEQLSDEQKDAIVDAAIEAARQQQLQGEGTDSSDSTDTAPTGSVEEQIAQLTAENTTLQESVNSLSAQLADQQAANDSLLARLTALEQALNSIGGGSGGGTGGSETEGNTGDSLDRAQVGEEAYSSYGEQTVN